MDKQKGSIGVFDSGFGGLTILKSIVKTLPRYDYLYLADSARAPYGTRSHATIAKFTTQAVEFLFKKGCPLVILACNTASSDALRTIQQTVLPKQYPNRRVLGVIIPSVEEAVSKTKNGKVGVMTTEATVNSNAFIREINKVESSIQVYQKACPLLVPLVESGEYKLNYANVILQNYVTPLLKKRIDTLILGCTHYEFFHKNIQLITGKKVKVIHQSPVVAQKLSRYLHNHPEIEKRLSKRKTVTFYSTDLTKNFTILGSKFFGQYFQVKTISLD